MSQQYSNQLKAKLTPLAWVLCASTLPLCGVSHADDFGIEEIIVTAQKRAQSMQDVGIAVTAFTQDQIAQLGISQPIDLAAQTPGLDIKNSVGNSNPVITIRGVGLNDYNTNNNPSAAVHVDEIYLGSNGYLGFQLFDIAQVEVLKGPQGTLYGRNTTAGSVNFISRRPSEQFEANIDSSFGNFNEQKLEAAMGGAITDTLRARIAVLAKKSDGHLTAKPTPSALVGFDPYAGLGDPLPAFNGDDNLGDSETQAWRLSLDWDVSESINAQLKIHGSHNNSELWVSHQEGTHNYTVGGTPTALRFVQGFNDSVSGGASTQLPFPVLPVTEFSIPSPGDERDVYTSASPKVDARQSGVMLKLSVDLDFAELISVTGYEQLQRDQLFQGSSPLRLFDTPFSDDLSQTTQELRLVGESDNSNWVVGAFYMEDKVDFDKTVSLVDVVTDFSATLEARVAPLPDGEFYILPLVGFADIDYVQEGDSWALFGQYEYQYSEQWQLTFGLRYTEEEKTFKGGTVGRSLIDGAPPLLNVLFSDLDITVDEVYSTHDVSGKLALNYSPNEDTLVYLSYSKGFKSGGFDGSTILQEVATIPFDEETLWSTELGFKTTLLEDTLQLNAAIYHYNFEDMQAEVTVDLGGGNSESLRRNAGKAIIIGGEMEIWWRPINGLDIRLGAALLDGEVKKFDSDDPAEKAKFEGNDVPDAPETSFNAMARYQWQLNNEYRMSASVNVNYSDEIYKDLDNTEVLKADGYTLWGGRIGLSSSNDDWELYLWGKNLNNELYQLRASQGPQGISTFYNMPRTYGIGFSYNWQ